MEIEKDFRWDFPKVIQMDYHLATEKHWGSH
jgi:hypothetical protein